ncbi:MAG TPA: hypothetical protein VF099_04055 [Ktedonobacterales bacterium]
MWKSVERYYTQHYGWNGKDQGTYTRNQAAGAYPGEGILCL